MPKISEEEKRACARKYVTQLLCWCGLKHSRQVMKMMGRLLADEAKRRNGKEDKAME